MTTIHVFLKPDELDKAGFVTKRTKHGDWIEYEGIRIYSDVSGLLMQECSVDVSQFEVSPRIPPSWIIRFTAHEFVRSRFNRTHGVYEHGSASAFVEPSSSSDTPGYWIKLSSPNIDDAKALWISILSGQATPKISFEQPQVPPPPATPLSKTSRFGAFIQRTRRLLPQK